MVQDDMKRLFSAGYRIFFLLAGMFAVLSMIVWEGWLAIHATGGMFTGEPFAMAPHLWHGHELIFGYGTAAVAGFLLTAAPNWVKARDASVAFFAVLSAVWLAGRMAIWWSGSLPPVVVAVVDLAFLPLVLGKVFAMLIKRPKPQQMMILGVMALVWIGNLMVHLDWMGLTATEATGQRAALLALAVLITILGGRVTPAFTGNAMKREGREERLPRNPMPLAAAGIAAGILAAVTMALPLPAAVPGTLAILAGLIALARLTPWRTLWTLRQPILWTLHLSYALNALGLIAFGAAQMGVGSEVAGLHLLAIGGVGGMTVAVMSRAAIGHSGRALVAPGTVVVAYALLPIAALARFAASAWPEFYYPGVLLSGGLWIVVFTLYTAALWPVFWGPRVVHPKAGVSA